jgi:glycine dehydrogenase subunit 1
MAHRLKGRPKVLIAKTLHPHYRRVIQTYVKNLGVEIEEIKYSETGEVDLKDLKGKLDDKISAFVAQSPNFMGIAENLKKISDLAHSVQALSIAVIAEPVSLGILEAPGKLGVDIAAGEGQSFGIPLGALIWDSWPVAKNLFASSRAGLQVRQRMWMVIGDLF